MTWEKSWQTPRFSAKASVGLRVDLGRVAVIGEVVVDAVAEVVATLARDEPPGQALARIGGDVGSRPTWRWRARK